MIKQTDDDCVIRLIPHHFKALWYGNNNINDVTAPHHFLGLSAAVAVLPL
jgi:hypothetical protein